MKFLTATFATVLCFVALSVPSVFAASYFITLTLSTTDPRVSQVSVSNFADFSVQQIFSYQPTIQWDICGGQSTCSSGTKNVYVRYLDSSGALLGTASQSFQYQAPVPVTPPPASKPAVVVPPAPKPVLGCVDPLATNYNSTATESDGTCTYPVPEPVAVLGCMDAGATNYNSSATESDGSCAYPEVEQTVTVEEVTTAAAVVGGSIGILGIIFAGLTHGSIFSEIGFMPVRLVFWVLAFLGIRKKGKSWGVVYDSKTKQALDPVYVTLVDASTGKEAMTALTDMEGRYGFLAPKGQYKISAGKTHYNFPSQDSGYKGESFVIEDGGVVAIDVPMDPVSFDWNEYEKQRMGAVSWMVRYRGVFGTLARVIFWIGFIVSVVSFALSVTPVTGIVLGVNIVLAIIHLGIKKKQSFGVVYDAVTRRPYAGIEIRFTLPEQPSIIIKKVSTDVRGRYYALLKAGAYTVSFVRRTASGEEVLGTEKVTLKEGMCDRDFILASVNVSSLRQSEPKSVFA